MKLRTPGGSVLGGVMMFAGLSARTLAARWFHQRAAARNRRVALAIWSASRSAERAGG
ncbi:hypothetical protein ACFSTI_25740 [Rhizorhabdus histidinilytica]